MPTPDYAAFRRSLARYSVDPSYRAALDGGGERLLREAVRAAVYGERAEDNPLWEEHLRRLRRQEDYVRAAAAESRFNSRELCFFGELVRNRCRMESAEIERHSSIRYFPLAFELTEGCRVQCSFCGFGAPPYRGSFAWNAENARLWEEILAAAKDFIGPAAGACPLYFATEPLDHPDYEKFLRKAEEIFGELPQTTTAAAEREPERFRALLRQAGRQRLRENAAVRVSVRSRAQFERLMEAFTAEELEDVEILANNPESVSRISDSGRAKACRGIAEEKRLRYSICCIAGFLVSLPRKEIRFVEPELPDGEFPLGYRVRAVRPFASAEEFRRALEELTAQWARYPLPEDLPLAWNRNIAVEPDGEGRLCFRGGGRISRVEDGIGVRTLVGYAAGRSFAETAEGLGLTGEAREAAYRLLQNLYLRGYLRLR